MEFLFVRHAQPDWVRDGRAVLDPALSEAGRSQADHLRTAAGRWEDVDEVWVSPTKRTRETAGPIVETLGLEPKIHPWLEEIRLPREWDGALAADMGSAFRDARERDIPAWWAGIPAGESFRDFHERVTGGLDDALVSLGVTVHHTDDRARVYAMEQFRRRVVVVGHGGTNSVAISHLIGVPEVPWSWERFVLAHASVSRIRSNRLLGGRIFGTREMSDVGHLPRELVSR